LLLFHLESNEVIPFTDRLACCAAWDSKSANRSDEEEQVGSGNKKKQEKGRRMVRPFFSLNSEFYQITGADSQDLFLAATIFKFHQFNRPETA